MTMHGGTIVPAISKLDGAKEILLADARIERLGTDCERDARTYTKKKYRVLGERDIPQKKAR